MAVNKVVFGGNTLIDLTGDTVTADKLMQGYTAHDKTGTVITGTATGGSAVVHQDQDGYIVLDDEPGETPTIASLSVTENGTYTAPTGVAYSPVTVNVSGGGGGGITTATLTYSGSSNTTPFNLYAPIITETYAKMSGVSEYLTASSSKLQTVDILLYNGASYVHIDNTVTSMSGDIEEDEDGYYFITGDCTITVS